MSRHFLINNLIVCKLIIHSDYSESQYCITESWNFSSLRSFLIHSMVVSNVYLKVKQDEKDKTEVI